MMIRKLMSVLLICLVSSSMWSQELEELLKKPHTSRDDILINAWLLMGDAIQSGDGVRLAEIINETEKLTPPAQREFKMLKCLAAAFRMDELYLKNVEFLPGEFPGYHSKFNLPDVQAVLDLDLKKIPLQLRLAAVDRAADLLKQQRKGSLTELWLLYFSDRQDEFFARIWAEGPELSATHRAFHEYRNNLDNNPEANLKLFFGAGGGINYYIKNDAFPNPGVNGSLTWGVYNIDSANLILQYTLYYDILNGTSPLTLSYQNLSHSTDVLPRVTLSLSLVYKLLKDSSAFNIAVGPVLRINCAWLSSDDLIFGGLGAGANLHFQLHLNPLHSTYIDLKTGFVYDSYAADSVPEIDHFKMQASLSLIFMDGYKTWERNRKRRYEQFNIPDYKPR